jgi:hypothetical protein
MYLFTGDYAAAKQRELRDEAARDRMRRRARRGGGSAERSQTRIDRRPGRPRRFMTGLKYLMQAQL